MKIEDFIIGYSYEWIPLKKNNESKNDFINVQLIEMEQAKKLILKINQS